MAGRKVLSVSFLIIIPFFLNYLVSFILDHITASSNLNLHAQDVQNKSEGVVNHVQNNEHKNVNDQQGHLIHVDVGEAHVDIPTEFDKETDVQITSPVTSKIDGPNKKTTVSVVVSGSQNTQEKSIFHSLWSTVNIGWLASLFGVLNGAWNFFTTIPINIIRFFLGWF